MLAPVQSILKIALEKGTPLPHTTLTADRVGEVGVRGGVSFVPHPYPKRILMRRSGAYPGHGSARRSAVGQKTARGLAGKRFLPHAPQAARSARHLGGTVSRPGRRALLQPGPFCQYPPRCLGLSSRIRRRGALDATCGSPHKEQLRTAAAHSALRGLSQSGTLSLSCALPDASACCDAAPRSPLVPTRPRLVSWGGCSVSRDTEGADHGLPPQGSPPFAVSPFGVARGGGMEPRQVASSPPNGLVEKAEVH